MSGIQIEKTYTKDKIENGEWREREFDACTFEHCNFENADLTKTSFVDCEFISCNLTNIKSIATAFQNATFKDCKMLGVNFSSCTKFLFEVSFENCILDFSIFQGINIAKTDFSDCIIKGADFSNANLTGAVFEKCNLAESVFENTQLTGADFSSAINFSIDPTKNDIRKAKFSLEGLPGLLMAHQIQIV